MRVSNPFKILGKVDATAWGCLIQFVILIVLVGLITVLIMLYIGNTRSEVGTAPQPLPQVIIPPTPQPTFCADEDFTCVFIRGVISGS